MTWDMALTDFNFRHLIMITEYNPAILVIDMVKDYFDPRRNLKIIPYAKAIVKPIKDLTRTFRRNGWPVIFATDSFKEDDFIFSARIEPESISGTEGAQLIDEIERKPDDLWLPKPRFSAFFQTRVGLESGASGIRQADASWVRKEW